MNRLKSEIVQAAVSPITVDNEDWFNGIYRFPVEFIGFSGHFPGYSIVPAIVQVMMAQHLAESRLPGGLRFCGVKNAKFFIQLRPAQDITVRCRLQPRDGEVSVEARLTCDEGLAASFILTFSPERAAA